MASTFTTNKNIEKPASGDYVNTWATPVNADWDILDAALGGVTSLNVTSQSGTIALTATLYQKLMLSITGTLTANVTYEIPTGVGGQWVVKNAATGAFTVTISSGGGGTSVVAPQGYQTIINCDGTNTAYAMNTPATAAGNATGQVQWYNSGVLGYSTLLKWDNSNSRLGVNNATPAYTLDVDGAGNFTGQVRVGTSVRFPDGSTQAVSATPTGFEVAFDGGGSAITTGIKGDLILPYAMAAVEWTLLADQSGSIVVDIWMDTYANYPPTVADTITGSAKPTISASNKGQSSTLTGWTTALPAGSTLRFNVDSVSTIQRVTLAIRGTRA
jgi:hypothetical protein